MSPNGTDGVTTPAGYHENGRLYGSFRPGRYLFPIDEDEMDRLDLFHQIMGVARRNAHYDCVLPSRARVLDLGTGTGIWAIDVSDRLWKGPHEHGSVVGLDLHLIQPRDVPSTVLFKQADIEEPLPVPQNEFDLVHARMLLGSIRDWTELYKKAFRHLRPNGHFEHVEIEWKFRSDDGSLPPRTNLDVWSDTLHRAMRSAGMPIDVNERTTSELRAIGFTDVTETIIKVPINPWNPVPEERELGRWFNIGMTHGMEAMTLAPFTRFEHWTYDQVQALSSNFKNDLCRLSYHAYVRLYIWTAKKPGQ